MTTLHRRDVIVALAGAGGVLGVAGSVAKAGSRDQDLGSIKKETDIACVYHCDYGDPGRIGQMLTNANNHLSVYDYDPFKIRIVIVTHGGGIKPLLTDLSGTPWHDDALDPSLFERYRALGKFGVEAYVCRITLKRNGVDESKVRGDSFIKLVPSGIATVVELQMKGFACVKIG